MDEADRMVPVGLRAYIKLQEYKGTCYNCQSFMFCQNFICMVVGKTDNGLLVCPIEILTCPHCHAALGVIQVTGDHLFNRTLTPPTKKGLN